MIGWYVHHHGGGHLRRLQAIRPHLRYHDVTVLSSLRRPDDWQGDWVHLPMDLGAHWIHAPQDNPLVPLAHHDKQAHTPAYKAVPVRLSRSAMQSRTEAA